MPSEEGSGFCRECDRQTLVRGQAPNHLVHALATVFLCGLWLPVWIIAALSVGPWRCGRCGSPVDIVGSKREPARTSAFTLLVLAPLVFCCLPWMVIRNGIEQTRERVQRAMDEGRQPAAPAGQPQPEQKPEAPDDRSAISGRWEQINDQKLMRYEFIGSSLIWSGYVPKDDSTVQLLRGDFVLDPNANPKRMTISNAYLVGIKTPRLFPAIYKIEGDTLTIRMGENAHPKSFDFPMPEGETHTVLRRVPR